MKRIFAAFLAVLCVLTTFLLPISASEGAMGDAIYKELRELVTVENYLPNANDSNIYLLSLVETGYGENGFEKDNAIYLYFYNPSRKLITSSVMNTVQMASEWDSDGYPTEYKKYSLLVQGTASNGLFIRAKIDKSAEELVTLADSKRKYGISGFELYETGNYNAEEYIVGYTYEFSGYGDSLKCTKQDFITLRLNVNQVNYISPTGEDGKYNQINSVYFTIPKELEEDFGDLYSVEYEYYYARTKPILVTDNRNLYSQLVDYKFENGKIEDFLVSLSHSYTSGLNGSLTYGLEDVVGKYGDYIGNKTVDGDYYFSFGFTQYYYLNSYASAEDIGLPIFLREYKPGEVIMSAFDLQEEFMNMSKIYSVSKNDLVREKYLKSLFQPLNYDGRDYTYTSYMLFEKNRDDLFDLTIGEDRNWWETLWNLDHPTSTETYDYIQPVLKYDVQSDSFCEDFLVNDIYKDEILEACKNENGDRVYLLHYAVSDQYFSKNSFVGGAENGEFLGASGDKCFSVEQNVYLDFDIIQLTFGNDPKALKTIAVVSSPSDGFADVYSPPTNNDNNKPDFMKWIKLALFFVLIALIILGVSKIVSFINAGSEASAYREMRKYYRSKNNRKR